jgi:hypothetical protein
MVLPPRGAPFALYASAMAATETFSLAGGALAANAVTLFARWITAGLTMGRVVRRAMRG